MTEFIKSDKIGEGSKYDSGVLHEMHKINRKYIAKKRETVSKVNCHVIHLKLIGM